MKRSFYLLVLGLLIVLPSICQAVESRKTQLPTQRISIIIFNLAPVSASVFDQIEREVTRILDQAGIEPRWVNCSQPISTATSELSPCDRPPAPNEFVLQLVAGVSRPRSGLKGYTLGKSFAPQQGKSFATLSCGTVRNLLERAQGTLLGYAAAHEMGHMLLGSNAHSKQGIMRAHWEDQDFEQMSKGALLFTPDQSRRMAENIQARQNSVGQTSGTQLR